MEPKLLAAVAVGGAVGSVARYLSMVAIGHWLGSGFPWGTLAVNVVGSMIMGVLVEASALVWSPSPEVRALLTVGVLGGFTTFSTFSLDVAYLAERHQNVVAAVYVMASVALSVSALYMGMMIVRQVVR
jgi:CrcB protein